MTQTQQPVVRGGRNTRGEAVDTRTMGGCRTNYTAHPVGSFREERRTVKLFQKEVDEEVDW